ncbi:MAG: hypothetical protein WC315_00340 [Candidatus Omnitrophota bacterium]|jgi:hypothetical protein
MRLQEFMVEYPQDVKRMKTQIISMTKIFSVLEMKDGEVFVETEDTDEEGVTTIEVLRSRDRTHFTIVWRERKGVEHNEMRSYPRDNQFPLFSVVRLNASI